MVLDETLALPHQHLLCTFALKRGWLYKESLSCAPQELCTNLTLGVAGPSERELVYH